MIAVSQSELAMWKRCRRQWYLRYYLGMKLERERPVGPSPLGTRVHAAFEASYGYGLDALAALHVAYALAIEDNGDFEKDLLAERELASAMVSGCIEWLAENAMDANLRVVATEQDVTVPSGIEGISLRGKLDQVAYDELSGATGFLDWKTSANFDNHEATDQSPQFRFYSLLMKLASRVPEEVVWGGWVRTLRRVKRGEKSKPPYYEQTPFWHTPDQLDATMRGTRMMLREIQAVREGFDELYAAGNVLTEVNRVQQTVTYPNWRKKDCSWDCSFTHVCPMMDDGSDWTGALIRSGRYVQGDPYAYYGDSLITAIRERLGATT